MRKLIPLVTLLTCAIPAGAALAADMEPSLPSDSRIKVLMYDEADVYTITTKYGYQTNIVFASNEEIETISVGDRSMWQIIPSGHRMFIRPMEENVTTNMTVLTNKRSYQFDLKSVNAEKSAEKGAEKNDSNIYVAKFFYPEERKMPWHPPVVTAPVAAPMSPPPMAVTPPPAMTPPTAGNLNYNYTYAGPDNLAPLQVFDDGKSTFIIYRPLPATLPMVYTVDKGGKEQLTSSYLRDEMLVIDTLAGQLSLKSDSGTVTIYNEMLNPR
jgi:type IV secretion system protein VirB9